MLPLVAPTIVLYLLANLAASVPALDAAGWTLAVCAGLLSLVPALAQRQDSLPGARRIAWMSFALAIGLVGSAQHAMSLPLEISARAAWPWAAALACDLAFDVPDQPTRLSRFAGLRRVLWAVAGITSLLGGLSVAGPLPGGLLVGEALGRSAAICAWLLLALALLLRVLRRRLGSEPEALAASAGAGTGTFVALGLATVASALILGGDVSSESAATRGLLAAAAASLTLGHLSLRGEVRPIGAARATRTVVAGFLSIGIVGAVVGVLAPLLPNDRTALGVVAAGLAVIFAGVAMTVREIVERLVAPDGGRLLAAVSAADRACAGARDIDAIGAAILPPLRRASRLADAEPLLFSLEPPRAVRIDAAGLAHVEPRSLSPALIERLTARPGEIVLRGPIEVLVVRRPDLRALAESLESLDALAVVPLVQQGEVEGAIVVPRGRRRSMLTLEELAALERLAARVTPLVGLLGTESRGQAREGDLMSQREKLEERIDALEDELARSRADAARVKEGAGGPSAAPLVAYGPAMRKVVARLDEISSLDAPVLLAFEPGVAAAPLVRRLHENSPRKMGPIVIADCANVRPEDAELALFGDDLRHGTPGWLRLAAGGTLFLDRATALGTDVLRELDEAIATRNAQSAIGRTPYAIDVRVVLGVHDDLDALVQRTSMDPGLAERVRPMRIDLPPLRDRPEDLGSLVLFAIDRACRASGSATLGIADDAMAELATHDWPGNELELFALIERAVRRATPPRITKGDVGALVVRESGDPLEGSLAEIERRALETALARAGGNKSEAARLLGVARTTFLDKLKRAGIEVPDERKSVRPPAPEKARESVPPKSRKTSAA